MVTTFYNNMFCRQCSTRLEPYEIDGNIMLCNRCRHSNGDTTGPHEIAKCAICKKSLTIDDMLAAEEICEVCRGDVEEETQ